MAVLGLGAADDTAGLDTVVRFGNVAGATARLVQAASPQSADVPDVLPSAVRTNLAWWHIE